MNHDDLEQLLGDAFDARARAVVPDHAVPPAPRFAHGGGVVVPLRRRWVTPVLAAAAAAAVIAGLGVVLAGRDDHPASVGSSHVVTKAQKNAQPVHVALLNSDGQTYGVGMPVIAYFSRAVTDARAFQAATSVTVNGAPIAAAWYFERSSAGRGPLEAHLRPEDYWPSDATVRVVIRSAGATAGRGLGFVDSLTLHFRTGGRTVIDVDGANHRLTLTGDGVKPVTCPVSLGPAKTPSLSGTKVIMDKQVAPTYGVPAKGRVARTYAQRLTYGGEFLRAAPAELAAAVRKGRNVSSGSALVPSRCAVQLYRDTRIGDLVTFVHTGGPAMQLGAGYGDWQVGWTEWLTGGVVPTR